MRTTDYRRRKFFFAPLALVALALFGAITMLLWNGLLPAIFSLPVINFWQALGLLLLARLLFGGFRPWAHWHNSSYRSSFKDKMSKMSPEEKREFFRRMHSYKDYKHEGETETQQP